MPTIVSSFDGERTWTRVDPGALARSVYIVQIARVVARMSGLAFDWRTFRQMRRYVLKLQDGQWFEHAQASDLQRRLCELLRELRERPTENAKAAGRAFLSAMAQEPIRETMWFGAELIEVRRQGSGDA